MNTVSNVHPETVARKIRNPEGGCMIPDEIRNRLRLLDSRALAGPLSVRFQHVRETTGLTWIQVVRYFAENGYTWEDAAAYFNTSKNTLRQYCFRRNAKFPFQGPRSPRTRARMKAAAQKRERSSYQRKAVRATAFGVTAPYRNLFEQFAHPSLTYAAFRSRVRRNWTVEDALTTPNNVTPGMGSPMRKTKNPPSWENAA